MITNEYLFIDESFIEYFEYYEYFKSSSNSKDALTSAIFTDE